MSAELKDIRAAKFVSRSARRRARRRHHQQLVAALAGYLLRVRAQMEVTS